MSYIASVGQELQKIVNCLEYEIKNMEGRYYSLYLSETISKRLKQTSKKLDALSERVKHKEEKVKYNATRIVWKGEIEADNAGEALVEFVRTLDFEELIGYSVSIHISRKEEKSERRGRERK